MGRAGGAGSVSASDEGWRLFVSSGASSRIAPWRAVAGRRECRVSARPRSALAGFARARRQPRLPLEPKCSRSKGGPSSTSWRAASALPPLIGTTTATSSISSVILIGDVAVHAAVTPSGVVPDQVEPDPPPRLLMLAWQRAARPSTEGSGVSLVETDARVLRCSTLLGCVKNEVESENRSVLQQDAPASTHFGQNIPSMNSSLGDPSTGGLRNCRRVARCAPCAPS